MKKKFPPILPGSKVGLVSPAGPVRKEQIQKGLDTLTQKNIQYEFGKHAFSDNGIVSGTVDERIEDINHFLRREDITAIWALRGGYGSIQLLDKFDYSLLKDHPKLLIGFSDLTALQWAVFEQTGLCSLSGFTLTFQFSPENKYLALGMEMVSGERTDISEIDLQGSEIQIITQGEMEGILIGGTLSMICSLCGTPYFMDRDDLILFLEDVNEPPYRIDRYFQQLALMSFWSRVKGVILGQFLYAEGSSLQANRRGGRTQRVAGMTPGRKGKPLDVASLLKPLLPPTIPIISNFPYGHVGKCIPLPQGALISLQTNPFYLSWRPFVE